MDDPVAAQLFEIGMSSIADVAITSIVDIGIDIDIDILGFFFFLLFV